MPSLIAAQTSTNAKIACFNGLIDSAAKLLSPIALASVAGLGLSAYLARTVQGQRGFGVATAATLLLIALQAPIVPRNKAMQQLLKERQEQYETDDGSEGARRIGEIRDLNYGRIALSLVATLACIYATDWESSSSVGSALMNTGRGSWRSTDEPLAVRKPEYGLE
jgi:hypothetical protein